jgi:hypothetical protein
VASEVGPNRYEAGGWLAQLARLLRGQTVASARAKPSGFTAFDLQQETERLLLDEARYGCAGQIEIAIRQVGKIVIDGEIRILGVEEEKAAIEHIWINLLRLGLLDELLALVERRLFLFPDELVRFVRYCRQQYDVCKERGQAIRRRHPDSDLFVMGCVVWGEEYIDNFLHYNVRSMLSDGNLHALKREGPVVFSIVTDDAGGRRIRQDPLFAEMTAIGQVEFTVIPAEVMAILRSGHLVRNFYILYGMLDHCSIYVAQAAHAHLFMIPVDAIVTDGSLGNMASYRRHGFECCGGGNIVAETETFLPALDARFGRDGPISIATADLATLAVEHAHHYFRSQILAAENTDFGKHPRELFWPVEGGVEIHSVFIHPLFISASALQRYVRRHFANIDYGMIPRMFIHAQTIKVIEDAREAYVNNFTAANRLYETTGRPFLAEDFMRSHDKYSYAVQRSLFTRTQKLPCRLNGWTGCRNVEEDVRQIDALLHANQVLPADKE